MASQATHSLAASPSLARATTSLLRTHETSLKRDKFPQASEPLDVLFSLPKRCSLSKKSKYSSSQTRLKCPLLRKAAWCGGQTVGPGALQALTAGPCANAFRPHICVMSVLQGCDAGYLSYCGQCSHWQNRCHSGEAQCPPAHPPHTPECYQAVRLLPFEGISLTKG